MGMAFAGIFQPFARLRWIRFGLLMRAVNSRAAFPFRKPPIISRKDLPRAPNLMRETRRI
jgi:hypothetical protein